MTQRHRAIRPSGPKQPTRYPHPRLAIVKFAAKRVLLGTLVFGIFAAAESLGQAYGIVAAYPHELQRQKVVESLASSPALGIFYGDANARIYTPTGYMVYRIGPMLALVGSVWGMMFINKWLRAQEEDGRWELLLAGRTTARSASLLILLGGAMGAALTYLLNLIVVAAGGSSHTIGASFSGSALFALSIALPVLFGMGVGAITSQLSPTKRGANLYGGAVLAFLFAIRAAGNIAPHLAWFKNLTPYGWIEKLHPFTAPSPMWLLPVVALIALCIGVALLLAGRRDLGESLLSGPDHAQPRLNLLDPRFSFGWRMYRSVLITWLGAALLFVIVVAGIAKTVAKSLHDSGSLTDTFGKLSGNPTAKFEIAYISIGSYLVAVLLMLMITTGMGSVRDEEASGRFDNFAAGTLPRLQWLLGRLTLLVGAAFIICLFANVAIWITARIQGIGIDAPKLVFGGLNILGPTILLLGGGMFIYGLLPRFTVWLMYAWVAWSFTADVLASILKLSQALTNTSLFHYLAFVPASNPDWGSFVRIIAIGLVLGIVGAVAFQRRDLAAE